MRKGTDIEAVAKNYISVMPVSLDYTAYSVLKKLKKIRTISI